MYYQLHLFLVTALNRQLKQRIDNKEPAKDCANTSNCISCYLQVDTFFKFTWIKTTLVAFEIVCSKFSPQTCPRIDTHTVHTVHTVLVLSHSVAHCTSSLLLSPPLSPALLSAVDPPLSPTAFRAFSGRRLWTFSVASVTNKSVVSRTSPPASIFSRWLGNTSFAGGLSACACVCGVD